MDSFSHSDVAELMQLCGKDETSVREMLRYTKGDKDQAAGYLFDDFKIPKVPSAPMPSPTSEHPPAYGPLNREQEPLLAIGWRDQPENMRKFDQSLGDRSTWDTSVRSTTRESAPPPERDGSKDNPINLDEPMPPLVHASEDEDLAKAMAMSLEDSGAGDDIRRATEASLADQQSVDAGGWDTQPPEKRIRLDLATPVILRSSTPLLTALPPVLQALYALEPFREAILALTLGHLPHEEGKEYTLEGYWRGETVWPTTGLNVADARSHAIMMAMQRLFVVMERTRRSTVQVSDLEALLAPLAKGQNPIDAARSALHDYLVA